jgi:hypothetical protein
LLVIYDDGQFAHINARDGQIQNPTMSHGKEPFEYLLDKVVSQDVIDKETGEILIAANTVISEEAYLKSASCLYRVQK